MTIPDVEFCVVHAVTLGSSPPKLWREVRCRPCYQCVCVLASEPLLLKLGGLLLLDLCSCLFLADIHSLTSRTSAQGPGQ